MDKHFVNFEIKNNYLNNDFIRNNLELKIQFTSKDKLLDNVVNKTQQIILNKTKDEIDKYYNLKQWDKIKKFTNPYEMIYITNKKRRQFSVSLYEPLSRSYFKMLEMSKEFLNDIININSPIKTVHLAEGPGGFIEGLLNIRKNKNDIYFGMTLKDTNKEIPGWRRSSDFLKKNTNVKILYGFDKTGNLYNIENHKFLQYYIGSNKVDVVTGDGGFDFSVDYNLQEFLANKLIFAQIIAAFGVLKIGGHFICKFFDTISNMSFDIIQILGMYFKNIRFFKPHTSRPANSEKYIICKHFYGINDKVLNNMRHNLNLWNKFEKGNMFAISLFTNEKRSAKIKKIIIDINEKIQNNQIKYIKNTINLIIVPYTNYEYLENKDKQIENARNWCKKYEI